MSSPAGSVTVPVLVTDRMLDGVVWLPTNSAGCAVRSTLLVDAGALVDVVPAPGPAPEVPRGEELSLSSVTSVANSAPVARNVPPDGEGFDKGLPQ